MKDNIKNQAHLFSIIWEEREHKSEISGLPLHGKGHSQWHWQFSHILPKGLYPSYRLKKENIILMTPEEHQLWEFKRHKIKDQEKWKFLFELQEKLKEEYHNGRSTRN